MIPPFTPAVRLHDEVTYGQHSPLGLTLAVPEVRAPQESYVGAHAADTKGHCVRRPDECPSRCWQCGQHLCIHLVRTFES